MTQNKTLHIVLRVVTTLAQWLLAATFLFSGFVKALDPMGMEHKLEAYCNHLGWNLPAGSIYLDTAAIVLALVEFTLGVYLLLGMRKRLTAVSTFVFMLVMTVVTIYIYLYSPVPDCGCFGDAILLTNGQTLAKNIVLLACAILLLFAGQHSLRIISKHTQWLLSLYALVYMIGVALYSLHYLPLVDFTGYDLGTKVEEAMRGEEDMTFVYEKNGKQQTFRMENLPDSTWKYVRTDTKVIRPATIKDFSFVDSRTQQEIGDELLADTGNVFIVTIPNLTAADAGCSDALNDIYDYARDHRMRFLCATATTGKDVSNWIDRTGAAYPFAVSSAETLEALVRANPGLVLIRDGRIVAKWSNNNLPDETELSHLDLSPEAQSNAAHHAFLRLFLWFVIPFGLLVLVDRLKLGHRYFKVYTHYKSQKNTPS